MLLRADFKPLSPFKGFPESFSIFGAICWGIRILYGKDFLQDMLTKFREKPPFLLSSPVLKYKDNLLFPKPQLPGGWGDFETSQEYKERKSFKKLSYVSKESLLKILEGNIKTEKELWESVKNEDLKGEFIKTINTLHAQINRITWTTGGEALYNEEATFIAVPFSVFIYFYDTNYIEPVQAALRFTQLGGNKSTGMGYYEVSFQEDSFLEKYVENKSRSFITLSPVFPSEHFILEESYYDVFPLLSAVDGFYETPAGNFWKKRVLYINKGSLIKTKQEKDFHGGIKEVCKLPDKTVYQYGYAFPLYVRGE